MDSSSSDESSDRVQYSHTSKQTEELEQMFHVCPYPDKACRMQLSMYLGMRPLQVKFWFQNRRNQMKMQVERDVCWWRGRTSG